VLIEAPGLRSKSPEELIKLLEEAVANEDYEAASEIRDELKRRQKKA
jgi:protein-arginine kinase activator protein McsA